MRKTKKQTPKRLLRLLSAKWDKDARTISEWFRRGDPMLTHPETIDVIEKYYGDENRKQVELNKKKKHAPTSV